MKNRSELLKDIPSHEREPLSEIWKSTEQATKASGWETFTEMLKTVRVRLIRSKVTTFFTLFTTTVSLILLCISFVVFGVINKSLSLHSEQLQVSVYLKEGTQAAVQEQLLEAARGMNGVANVKLVSKDAALQEFAKMVGAGSPLVAGLDHDRNPLPASLEISFTNRAFDQAMYERVINDFGTSSHVESVVTHGGSLSELSSLMKSVRTFIMLASIGIILIVAFLIASTIRLSVFSYQDEIEIMELVGATPKYMRMPFMFEGAAIGTIGAVIACFVSGALVRGIYSYLESTYLFNLLGKQAFVPPTLSTYFTLVFLGLLFGALSSWLATAKNISFFK